MILDFVNSDNGGSKLLQSVCDYLPINTAAYFWVYYMFGPR
jgi:hypothetical protein